MPVSGPFTQAYLAKCFIICYLYKWVGGDGEIGLEPDFEKLFPAKIRIQGQLCEAGRRWGWG